MTIIFMRKISLRKSFLLVSERSGSPKVLGIIISFDVGYVVIGFV